MYEMNGFVNNKEYPKYKCKKNEKNPKIFSLFSFFNKIEEIFWKYFVILDKN